MQPTAKTLVKSITTVLGDLQLNSPENYDGLVRVYAKTYSLVVLTNEGLVTPTKAAYNRLLSFWDSVNSAYQIYRVNTQTVK